MSEPAQPAGPAGGGRLLGVDYGTRRIGLAVSDPGGAIAFPVGALESRGLRRDLEAFCALVREREVERIVVGLPLRLSGRRGPECDAAERFAAALREATGLPVDLFDERWTTLEAERTLRQSGEGPPGDRRSRRRRRGGARAAERRRAHVDSVAATLLLRTYLERRSRAAEHAGRRGADVAPTAEGGAAAEVEGVGER